jgi:phosphonopyruvate decarboxylase
MIDVKRIVDLLIENEVNFYTGVPDSLLKDFCSCITDTITSENNIVAANEGAAVALAAGNYLATGKLPLVYMQNSGLGNTINPLLSLVDEEVYKIPLLLFIGWRGEPGIKDEPQHKKQGKVTMALLDAMQIPAIILEADDSLAAEQLTRIIKEAKKNGTPRAVVIRKDTFGVYQQHKKIPNTYPLSREEAVRLFIDEVNPADIVVTTTGKLSRELFEYREFTGTGHSSDFLTVGSMGHSSSIALGIAIAKPKRTVWCLDGDGAFIMHMGAATSVGHISPVNYKHIVFNNGTHESVGVQPTCAFGLDFSAIALGCRYKKYWKAENAEQFSLAVKHAQHCEGPVMIEVLINTQSRKDLGRPTISPVMNKINFISNLSVD